jgi:hypothetical protein
LDLGSARCTLSNVEFLELCDTLSNVELQSGVEDSHIWKLSSSGQYTAKLAYRGLYQGSVRLFSWRGSERLGHWPNVASSCGLSHAIDAGQQIG